jgi:hypothetical protein
MNDTKFLKLHNVLKWNISTIIIAHPEKWWFVSTYYNCAHVETVCSLVKK